MRWWWTRCEPSGCGAPAARRAARRRAQQLVHVERDGSVGAARVDGSVDDGAPLGTQPCVCGVTCCATSAHQRPRCKAGSCTARTASAICSRSLRAGEVGWRRSGWRVLIVFTTGRAPARTRRRSRRVGRRASGVGRRASGVGRRASGVGREAGVDELGVPFDLILNFPNISPITVTNEREKNCLCAYCCH